MSSTCRTTAGHRFVPASASANRVVPPEKKKRRQPPRSERGSLCALGSNSTSTKTTTSIIIDSGASVNACPPGLFVAHARRPTAVAPLRTASGQSIQPKATFDTGVVARDDEGKSIGLRATFEEIGVSKPLASVRKITEQGGSVTFTPNGGLDHYVYGKQVAAGS